MPPNNATEPSARELTLNAPRIIAHGLISMAKNPSLQDLEGDDWGEPMYDSYLVQTVHALRRKPIVEFTVEDLRIMIGQLAGVNHLVPLALSHLEQDAFVAGDFYPGDLLGVVMSVGAEYWRSHPTEAARMRRVADRAAAFLDAREENDEIEEHLRAPDRRSSVARRLTSG